VIRIDIPDDIFTELIEKFLNEEDTQLMKEHMQKLRDRSIELNTPLILSQPCDDKVKRAAFHQFFKDHIP